MRVWSNQSETLRKSEGPEKRVKRVVRWQRRTVKLVLLDRNKSIFRTYSLGINFLPPIAGFTCKGILRDMGASTW